MKEAGYEEIQLSTVSATVERPDALGVAKGFVEGTPMVLEIRDKTKADIGAVTATVARAIEAAYGAQPKIPLQEIVFTAVKR